MADMTTQDNKFAISFSSENLWMNQLKKKQKFYFILNVKISITVIYF